MNNYNPYKIKEFSEKFLTGVEALKIYGKT